MHRQPLNPYNTFEIRMIDFEGNIGEKSPTLACQIPRMVCGHKSDVKESGDLLADHQFHSISPTELTQIEADTHFQ